MSGTATPWHRPAIARIYGNIRTAHLERFAQMAPATVLYTRARYDYDESVIEPTDRPLRLSRLGVVLHLLRHRYQVVELNEPLVWRRWPDLAAQILAVRLRAGLGRGRTRVVAYCIGYSDPGAELAERFPAVPRSAVRAVSRVVAGVLARRFDRLAFGTAGCLQLYRAVVGRELVDRRGRLFEALPSACDCEGDGPHLPGRLLFVGSFQPRKGVEQLMAAWDAFVNSLGGRQGGQDADHDGAQDPTRPTLELIGKGPMLAQVMQWAQERPEVVLTVDPHRARIHQALRRSTALILLSQPLGAWREQIGLPILEGLAHGLEIITTDQTGLADWLSANGHAVTDRRAAPAEIAAVIRGVLGNPRPPEAVLAALPSRDQRIEADCWMTEPTVPPIPAGRPGRLAHRLRTD